MSLARFRDVVRTTDELAALVGPPGELVIRKQLPALDDHMQAFIARAPLLLLGTVGNDGRCDVSPRGDMPAAATVLDAKTLIIADRPGNRRTDSLRNIIDTGRVGMLLLVPGLGETLRINGRACVLRDTELLAALAADGKQPALAIGVEIEECYFQCAKALIRSKLWQNSAAGPDPAAFDFARILIDETRIDGESIESLRQRIDTSYRERLY